MKEYGKMPHGTVILHHYKVKFGYFICKCRSIVILTLFCQRKTLCLGILRSAFCNLYMTIFN